MTVDYPTDTAPATAQYVLDVIRAWHRLDVAANGAKPRELTFETPLWEWEDALGIDDLGSSEFGVEMNATWGIDTPASEWREFQRNATTLGDLCRVIASRATQPVIRPWNHIAGDCLPAGAFLTLRAMLAEVGEDPSRVTPSTRLAPFLTRGYDEFWERLSRLAPGCGPLLLFSNLERLVWRGLQILVLLALPVGFLAGSCLGVAIGMGLFVLGMIAIGMAGAMLGSWQFPDADIHTFRDLAYCLAGQEPRRRIQTTS